MFISCVSFSSHEMFKKSFRVKSQTVMKGSDRKKLRAELGKAFQNLDPDVCCDIIPSKEEVTMVKIYTHTGENTFIYCVNKIPMLFEIDKKKIIYPSVYLLWRYPELVYRFTTWPPVFRKLTEGADLMLPGVIVRGEMTPNTFKGVEKGQICSVSLLGNRAPVAVGYTMMSGSDMFDSGMKGKGVHVVHYVGDELWLYGDKSNPPDLGDDPLPPELAEEMGNEGEEADSAQGQEGEDQDATGRAENAALADCVGLIDSLNLDKQGIDGMHVNDKTQEQSYDDTSQSEVQVQSHDETSQLEAKDQLSEAAEGDQSEYTDLSADVNAEDTTQEEMDARLKFCFRCAIKCSVKKVDLPLLTSTFYAVHMTKYCTADKILDVKQSSYKKLSKFLQHQEKTGIITIKELSKGIYSIVEVDRSHEDLRGLEVPEVIVEQSSSCASQTYTPPVITEMLGITAAVLPLFRGLGYSKGDALKSSDVRKIVTDYVKAQELQHTQIKSEVVLDPFLAEILLQKSEGDRATLKWDEVFTRLQDKMTAVQEVKFEGRPPILKKGNMQPIKLDVVQRASNKKVTVIDNLEEYGIDPKQFGHTVQVKVACSASVTPSQQKNKGPQVVIQGNQINSIADLLLGTYKIPKKYITGLGKAPKSKKR